MGPRIQIKHGRQTAEEKKLEAKYDLLRKKKELKLAKKMVKDAEKKAKTEKTMKKNEREDDDATPFSVGDEKASSSEIGAAKITAAAATFLRPSLRGAAELGDELD